MRYRRNSRVVVLYLAAILATLFMLYFFPPRTFKFTGEREKSTRAMAVKSLGSGVIHIISSNYPLARIDHMTPENFKVIGNVMFSVPRHHEESDKSAKGLYYTSPLLNVLEFWSVPGTFLDIFDKRLKEAAVTLLWGNGEREIM